jgi:hypothetical protein
MSFVNVFGGDPVQPSQVSLGRLTLTQNTALSWPSQFQNTNNVTANILEVNPTDNNYILKLPDATIASLPQTMILNNVSMTYSFQLYDYDDNQIFPAVEAQHIYYLYLSDNEDAGGTWRICPYGEGLGQVVTSVGATALTNGLTITSSSANPIITAGTLRFALSNNLVALSDMSTVGVMVRSVDDPAAYVTRTLQAGSNISITNPTGVAGNPQLSLSASPSGLTSIGVGNINIANNTIETGSANLPLILAANGTGNISLQNDLDLNSNDISAVDDLTAQSATIATLTAPISNLGNLTLQNNTIAASNANGDLTLSANGTGSIILSSPLNGNNQIFSSVNGLTTTTLNAGNVSIVNNIISCSQANTDLSFSTNGTGKIQFNNDIECASLTTLTAYNISCNTISTTAAANSPVPRAYVYFSGITTVNLINTLNVSGVTRNSVGNYTVQFSVNVPVYAFVQLTTAKDSASNFAYANVISIDSTNARATFTISTGADISFASCVLYY